MDAPVKHGTLLGLLSSGSKGTSSRTKKLPGCLYPFDLGVDLGGRCRSAPTNGIGLCSIHSCPHVSGDKSVCGLEKDESQSQCQAHTCPHVSDSRMCGADKRSRQLQCPKHSCPHLNQAGSGRCGKDKKEGMKFWYDADRVPSSQCIKL